MKFAKRNYLLLILLLTFTSSMLVAQDGKIASHTVDISVPNVAILDIEPANNSITLGAAAPTEAGDAFDFSTNASDNTLWINYSSTVGSITNPLNNEELIAQTRRVTVQVIGVVPPGMILKVQASEDAGNGNGAVGTPVADALTLSLLPQDLITNIGTCYTGTPEQNGHNLTYTLESDENNFSALNLASNTTLTVSYTLTDL